MTAGTDDTDGSEISSDETGPNDADADRAAADVSNKAADASNKARGVRR